jgi:hypothetical protein
MSMTSAIHFLPVCLEFSVIADVIDTGNKFIGGDNDTSDKLIASDIDAGDKGVWGVYGRVFSRRFK